MSLDAEIDRLYSLPLAEFVAARNTLARELRARGERDRADRVKALAKPNVSAWAVNLLWHGEREAFDRLLEAGAAVRAAVGTGDSGREAAARRREATRSLLALAKKLLSDAGHPATPAVLQKISHTLDAVVARGVEEADPPLGRLSRDLEAPGFGFLAGIELPAAPRRGAGGGKKAAARTRRAAEARAKVADSSPPAAGEARRAKRIEAARKELEEKRAALAAAEAKVERLDSELAAAQKVAQETAAAARRAAEAARTAAQSETVAKTAEKEAAKAARAARTAARRAASAVESGESRLAKLVG